MLHRMATISSAFWSCFSRMIFHREQSRSLHGARHRSNPNARRWALSHTYLAIGFLFLLLCTTFTVSPSFAAKGGGIRSIGKEARALLTRWFSRKPSISEADEFEEEGMLRRSSSSPELTDADAASSINFRPDDETSLSEGSSGTEMSLSSKKEIALKAQEVYQGSDAALKDPLYSHVPLFEGLIFRHFVADGGYDFKVLQRRSYLQPTEDSIGYIAESDTSESYMLRFICVVWKRDTLDEGHLLRAIKARFAAALNSVNRLPQDVVEDLIKKGVSLPQFAGTVLSVPEIYSADSLVCGKYAFLYPAAQFNLHDLLESTELSGSAMMYLTVRAVQIVADLHSHRLAHQALTTRSFWIDEEGDLHLLLEDDLSEGSASSELVALLRPSGSQGEAGVTAMESNLSNGRAHGSSEVSYHDVFPQPSSSTPYGSGIGSTNGTMRLKKKSVADPERYLTLAQMRDASDLGLVLFAIWCGISQKPLQAETLKTSTLLKKPKISFKTCKGHPPSGVRKLIRALQHPRTSQQMLPEDAVTKSALFSQLEALIAED